MTTAMTTEFKVGDRVARMSEFYDKWDGFPRDILSVKRVMIRFIELENGSQWTREGDPYPFRPSAGFRLPYISHLTPELLEKMEVRKLYHEIEKLVLEMNPSRFTREEMEQLKKLLTKEV